MPTRIASHYTTLSMKLFSVALSFLLLVPSLVFADMQETRQYLREHSSDGWVAMAQYAVGDTANAAAIDRSSVFSFSKSILAFIAAGKNLREGIQEDLVSDFVTLYVHDGQIGSVEYINDDFWGVLAFRAAGMISDHRAISDARSLIERAQKPNGGWSWSPTYPVADTDDTAAAVMALLESGVAPSDPMIQRALGYLRSAQNVDGGFPSVPPAVSSIESTSWVVSALWKAGENPTTWTKSGKDPLTYLRNQEKSDGSFGGVQTTAFAVIALAGKSYPVRSYVPPRDEPGASQSTQSFISGVIPLPALPPKPVVKKASPVKKKVVKKPVKKFKKKK